MANAIQSSTFTDIFSTADNAASQDFSSILDSINGFSSSSSALGQTSGNGSVDVSNLLNDAPIGGASVSDGSNFVNAKGMMESLSGLQFVGLAFGNSLLPNRNKAVNAAIQSGQVRNYAGSHSQVGGDWAHVNPIGNVLGRTVGLVGHAAGAVIAEVPVIGNADILGVSVLTPLLNIVFGQLALPKSVIERNALYNFGPRATAFENLGTAYGAGVADGLRGTNPTAPAEQKIPIWDDAMGAINNVLRAISTFNLPVISMGADFLRGLARGAKGDEMFDIINSSSKDPMDPSWTAFSAPIGVASSLFFKMAAPLLGLNQQAMDMRLGRAIGDMMNVYDVFLPGDHTRHGFGSFFPRLIFGSPNTNMLHAHNHQFNAVQYAVKHGAPIAPPSSLTGEVSSILSGIPGMDLVMPVMADAPAGGHDMHNMPGM